jgi:hypothetical protein
MLRATCPRKWFYRYVLKIQRRGYIDSNLLYGTLVHFWLNWLYSKGKQGTTEGDEPSEMPEVDLSDYIMDVEKREEVELAIQKAWLAFKAYRWHYRLKDAGLHVIANEQLYEIEYRGFKLTGKIDMVARPTIRDGVFIWDWKTAGRLDATVLDAWSFRFQFLYYCWLYWKVTGRKPSGTIVNGLVKCQLRPRIADRVSGRKESREEYLNRVKFDLQAKREKYFYRQRMPLGTGQLEWFEVEMLIPNLTPFARMQEYLHLSQKLDTRNVVADGLAMNTSQCHMYNSICEYLPLCRNGKLQLGEYFVRETKHPELEQEQQEANGVQE